MPTKKPLSALPINTKIRWANTHPEEVWTISHPTSNWVCLKDHNGMLRYMTPFITSYELVEPAQSGPTDSLYNKLMESEFVNTQLTSDERAVLLDVLNKLPQKPLRELPPGTEIQFGDSEHNPVWIVLDAEKSVAACKSFTDKNGKGSLLYHTRDKRVRYISESSPSRYRIIPPKQQIESTTIPPGPQSPAYGEPGICRVYNPADDSRLST